MENNSAFLGPRLFKAIGYSTYACIWKEIILQESGDSATDDGK